MQPSVTVLIPARDEEDSIQECVRHLLAQEYPAGQIEVLVIDGCSRDDTASLVREMMEQNPTRNIRLIHNEHKLTPHALNVGIREATGDIIALMNAHTFTPATYIRDCVRALMDSGAANAGGKSLTMGTTPFGRAVAMAMTHPLGVGNAKYRYSDEPQYVDTVFPGMYWKDVSQEVGLFDESMIRNQDYEMNVRIRQTGKRIYMDPSITLTYTARSSFRKLLSQYFQYGWWRVQTWKRHPSSLKLRQLVPAGFVMTTGVLASLSFLPAARIALGALLAIYFTALVIGTMRLRERDRRFQYMLLVPVAMMTMHLSYGAGFIISVCSFGRLPYRAGPPRVPEL